VSSREIIHLDQNQNPKKNLILTENYSASGVRFTTNEKLESQQFLLIYLNDQLMREINKDNAGWVKSGDYYLTRVVWARPTQESKPSFNIGVEFIEKKNCNHKDLEVFAELMNVRMLEKVNAAAGTL
jgi:hypothetical protein